MYTSTETLPLIRFLSFSLKNTQPLKGLAFISTFTPFLCLRLRCPKTPFMGNESVDVYGQRIRMRLLFF